MNRTLKFLPEAQKDFEQLAGNQKLLVAKALDKVVQNPVSIYEGGYGKPLGSKSGTDLSGLLKIKLRDAGLRIVSAGSVVLQYGINGLGTLVIAGHTAARKLFAFTDMPLSAMASACSTYVSQNYGANHPDRVRRGMRDI